MKVRTFNWIVVESTVLSTGFELEEKFIDVHLFSLDFAVVPSIFIYFHLQIKVPRVKSMDLHYLLR